MDRKDRLEYDRIIFGRASSAWAQCAHVGWTVLFDRLSVVRELLLVLPFELECEWSQEFETTYDATEQGFLVYHTPGSDDLPLEGTAAHDCMLITAEAIDEMFVRILNLVGN